MKGKSHEVTITQAESITGKNIRLRNVAPSDAEFIVKIRTNEKKGVLLALHLVTLVSKEIGLKII